jgi:hypothetical protein
MIYVGLDSHRRFSAVSVVDKEGKLIEQRRILDDWKA